MSGRPPGWRLWGTIGVLAALYAIAGYWLSSNGNVEMWLYRIGLTVATVLPLCFTLVYSFLARWWKDEIGTSVVLAILSVVPTAGPLAWVFWFNGGVLTSTWLAWLEVSGPVLTSLALARMCWVWLRTSWEAKYPAHVVTEENPAMGEG